MTEDIALNPPLGLLVKLGSLIVHLEEAISPKGHDYDLLTARSLRADEDVEAWMTAMKPFLPVKR